MSYHHRQARARDAPSDPPAQEDEENQSLLGSAPTRAAPRSVPQPQPQHQHNISSASSSPISAFDFDHKAWTKAAAVAFVLLLALYNIITSSGSTSSLQLSSIPKAETAVSASKIEQMTSLLESSTIRYYVYDDDKLVLSDIREKAVQDAPKTWRANWGHRFFDYARGEIRWIEALERHPQRTQDPCEANFFIVPIPVGAALFWGQSQLLKETFETLFKSTLYQQHPERHVAAFATTEKIFGWKWWGLSDEEMKNFKSAMIVRDSDGERGLKDWANAGKCAQEYKLDNARKYFSHVVSLGYGGEGSKSSNVYSTVTTESWNKKQFWYFYHTRKNPSICNSTQFRHRFFANSTRLESFEHQPFSIGFDVPPDEWAKRLADSKFCLVIRGDQPGSKVFFLVTSSTRYLRPAQMKCAGTEFEYEASRWHGIRIQ